MSTIWDNRYVYAEHYRCDTALYLLSILSQDFNKNIYRGISATGYGREFVDGMNTTDTRFIFHLMDKVELPGNQSFETQMEINT